MTISFIGTATPLANIDLPRIGHEIGVGEDEIHAVLDTETSGSGFDSQHRPKMLFEPHVFYRNLTGSIRTEAVNAGLAYAKWGMKPYPADSYPRLLRACQINEVAALKSASWGLGQILGENYIAAGFDDVRHMVTAFCDSEAAQLQGMVAFIKHNHLDDELRSHNWAAFARGYNGAGYAKNNYHTKLASAFAKWQKIKDTPFTPS